MARLTTADAWQGEALKGSAEQLLPLLRMGRRPRARRWSATDVAFGLDRFHRALGTVHLLEQPDPLVPAERMGAEAHVARDFADRSAPLISIRATSSAIPQVPMPSRSAATVISLAQGRRQQAGGPAGPAASPLLIARRR